MTGRILFGSRFMKHVEMHKKAGNKTLVKKIAALITELRKHSRTGTGKPEQLRNFQGEIWSRRIDAGHRLIYEIVGDGLLVILISAYGHGDEKQVSEK